MPSQENTYRKLDRDTAKNKVDKESMYECRNFRLIGDNPNESGALINILGNEQLQAVFPGFPTDVVIGSKQIRDTTLLITSNSTSLIPIGTSGRLWTWDFKTDSVPLLIYNGLLNLSRAHPIGNNIVTHYESAEIIKAYWADGYNKLRGCNIADPDLDSQDPDDFNIVNDVSFEAPVFERLLGGNIPVSRVQYAYRLYKRFGPQTTFSPASKMINLTTENEGAVTTVTYGGADQLDDDGEALNSGKAVQMSISNIDQDYDKIEIVAILYYDVLSAPQIWIVQTTDVSDKIYFTDTGTYENGYYTLEEYTALSNIFTPKTLTTKNNILFAGNVTTEEFDVEYDARAYRFQKSVPGISVTNIKDSNGGYYGISYNIDEPGDSYYSAYGAETPPISSLEDIPETWDCIQDINDLTINPAGTSEIYQMDADTPGGEGPNVKFEFKTTDYLIDDSGDPSTFHVGGNQLPFYFPSFASPFNSGYRLGYQIDEIYRFGVILWSTKGQVSPVKLIGDIRFPNNVTVIGVSDCRHALTYDGDEYGTRLYLEFTLDNLPDDVAGYQIVRVERKPEDRTIVFQGKMSFMGYDLGIQRALMPPDIATSGTYSGFPGDQDHRKRMLWITAPEISFYKDFRSSAGDYVQVIGYYASKQETNYGADDWHNINKYRDFTPIAYDTGLIRSVDNASVVEANPTPDEEPDNLTFAGFPYKNIVITRSEHPWQKSNAGTGALVILNSAVDLEQFPVNTWPVVNYRRPVVQYGGRTYEAKLSNKFIPAGEYIPVSGSSSTEDCRGGDNYIAMFDHLHSFYNREYAIHPGRQQTNTSAHVDYFPVESTINLELRHDDCFHKIRGTTEAKYYMKEVGNAEYSIGDSEDEESQYTFSPGWTDYYLYNTVFSRAENARQYIPVSNDYNLTRENDSKVIASNAKFNGEEIDAWSIWGINESIELDSGHGPIKELVAWNNNILFFQEKAFGSLAIFDRSLIQDSEGQSLSLGEGDVLQRYDIISNETGISTRGSIVVTPSGVVWYDKKHKRMYRLSKSLENMGVLKGLNSYLTNISDTVADNDNTIAGTYLGFQMTYNSRFNEIWFTVKSGQGVGETLVFNEIMDDYTLFIDNNFTMGYMSQDDILLSHTLYGSIWQENSFNVPRGSFYGVIKDAVVEVIVNPMGNLVYTLTNLEFTTEVLDVSDNNIVDETLTSFRITNDYQDTGVIALGPGTNTRRLLRTWRVNTLRDAAYLAQMRDSYSKVRMVYTNDAGTPRKIILHDLISVFAVPIETMVNKK